MSRFARAIAPAPSSGRPFNTIDAADADAVRRYVRKERARDDIDASEHGIFGPIAYATATGRARCRECGEKIAKGERCVTFQLDLYVKRFGKWGNAVTAYIHVNCERKGDA